MHRSGLQQFYKSKFEDHHREIISNLIQRHTIIEVSLVTFFSKKVTDKSKFEYYNRNSPKILYSVLNPCLFHILFKESMQGSDKNSSQQRKEEWGEARGS